MQAWLRIGLGAIFEVSWVVGFKHAQNVGTWGLTVVAVGLSFYFLITASRYLPAGTVYAVFVGLGTLGTTVVGMTVFHEPFSWVKVGLIALLILGIGGLQTVTARRRS